MGNDEQRRQRPGAGSQTSYTLRDLLIVASYHRRIMIIVFLVTFAAACVAAWFSPIRYEAEARLLVLFNAEQSGNQDIVERPSILSIDGLRATESEVDILRGRTLIRDMVRAVGVSTLFPDLHDTRMLGLGEPASHEEMVERATDLAEGRFRIAAQSGSNLVLVGYAHEDRDVAIKAVDALIKAYLARRSEIYANPRSRFLVDETEKFRGQIDILQQQLAKAKTRFQVLNLEQEILLAVNQEDSIIQRRRHVLERRESLLAEVATAKQRLGDLPERVFDFAERTNRTDNDEARNSRIELQLERDQLRARYQDNHPRLKEIERQLQTLQRFQDRERPVYFADRDVRNPAIAFLTNHLLQLEIEADATERQIAELDRQRDVAQLRIAELRQGEQTIGDLARSLDVVDKLYRQARERAESARLEEESALQRASNVRVVEYADAPARGRSQAVNLVAAGLFGGVLLAAVAGLAAAWNRRVYLLPLEVERGLGLPVLATFNEAGGFIGGGAQQQMVYFVGRLLAGRDDGQALRTIQILSAGDQEHRDGFARALATELAEGHARRTLLIDLDRDGNGQAGALRAGEARELGIDGIRAAATRIPDLEVTVDASGSTLGRMRTEVGELATLVEQLSNRYDFVIIDAPATRSSFVALRLAPVIDGSILVIRSEHTRSPVAANTRDQVLDAGGDMLGAVVTGRRFHIPRAIYRWL
ncbi:lipopolysaccharide biosynthesis protein [Tistrella bauzanensis]|uniref:GumC family protein n=1 Tax=Tistrella TaxID=171436 RepID=UPI0031F69DDB